MIVGSLAGPLCAGGGFCAGSGEIVEHQRISASAYTFSAALPAMLATTASESLGLLQTTPDLLTQVRENIKAMWAQLDPRSDWVYCSSSVENPIMLLVLKPEVVASKKLGIQEQEALLQEVVDEVRRLYLEHMMRRARANQHALCTDAGQRGADHAIEEHAQGSQRGAEGYGVGAAASVEGVHQHGPFAEGDGEGGHYNPARHHEGGE